MSESILRSKKYWIVLVPALCWHVLYLVIASDVFDSHGRVYVDLVFYIGLAVYFYAWRGWRFHEWRNALKGGKAFWRSVVLTVLGMAAMFGASMGLVAALPTVNTAMSVFKVDGWLSLTAFVFVTILLPPIAEEAFHRQAVTAFDSKAVIGVTVAASVLLYASEHSLAPLGFAMACMWAIPLSIAYVRTRNVYVCMTAHFICNFVMNGITVVITAFALLS
jgi:membrane protease YdiL (CAAX protease family)